MRAMLADDAGDQDASSEAFHILSIIVNGRLKRRLLTVVDATNLRQADRKRYHAVAARYGIPTIAIAFDMREATYQARNAGRSDRVVQEAVVSDQSERMVQALRELAGEDYHRVHVVRESGTIEALGIDR
jgi:predicted kinase